jgi:hypothetical protein
MTFKKLTIALSLLSALQSSAYGMESTREENNSLRNTSSPSWIGQKAAHTFNVAKKAGVLGAKGLAYWGAINLGLDFQARVGGWFAPQDNRDQWNLRAGILKKAKEDGSFLDSIGFFTNKKGAEASLTSGADLLDNLLGSVPGLRVRDRKTSELGTSIGNFDVLYLGKLGTYRNSVIVHIFAWAAGDTLTYLFSSKEEMISHKIWRLMSFVGKKVLPASLSEEIWPTSSKESYLALGKDKEGNISLAHVPTDPKHRIEPEQTYLRT